MTSKKMDTRSTVHELTQCCIEIRRSLEKTFERKDQEEIVLRHIEAFAKREERINDFQAGLEWFNVAEELSTKRHLIGKITILDFFTYCCINCMHILPDLAALERKFSVKDGLVVIGVHSAKFSNERSSEKLLSAVQRHSIHHPVVNDSTLSTWRDFGISCWPTLVMIGPSGEPLAVFVGEGHREELFLYVAVALSHFKSSNRISTDEIPLQPARHLLSKSRRKVLLFPGKLEIFQTERGERLAASDTGNNRILVLDNSGRVEYVIGGNDPGYVDGEFKVARFNAPQGVCMLDNSIYVADNENHCIRKIDLKKGVVSTVVGTGCQGHDYIGGKIGKDQALSSPWDVAIYNHVHGETSVPILLIAIAGTHQIWSFFLEDTVWWKNRKYKADTCVAIVGSGREENRNNSYPHAAGLAQPSGLVVAQESKAAFFADSESSSIRRIDLTDGRVSAVCGANRNPTDLHDYGDVDGSGYAAKLQHPLGLAWHSKEKVLYIADTYNQKIKKIDPANGYCETVCGDGRPTEKFLFDEPNGVAVGWNGRLYVADTNNHAIKTIDLKSGNIATLSIEVSTTSEDTASEKMYFFDTTIDAKGGELDITFGLSFGESNLKLNPDAPQTWSVDLPTTTWTARARTGDMSKPISIKISEGTGTNELRITLNIVACKATECIPKRLFVVHRIHQKSNAPTSVSVDKQLVVE